MLAEVAAIYRSSKKRHDINRFTEYVARPPAAIVVYALKGTRITPNQITFGSAIACAGAAARIALAPGWAWLVAAALGFAFSFVLDCAGWHPAPLATIASRALPLATSLAAR